MYEKPTHFYVYSYDNAHIGLSNPCVGNSTDITTTTKRSNFVDGFEARM